MLYTPYRNFLSKVFPQFKRVRKLPLSGGMTCPNLDGKKGILGCTYCNNKSFSPVWDLAHVSVREQLETRIPGLRAKYPEAGILAYFQPYTNTYAPVERLREIFTPAFEHPEIAGVAVGTRPDCLSEETVALLAEFNQKKPVIVEIGLQTANDRTLERIHRGHTVGDFKEAVRRVRARGLWVTTHLILGLPGETISDFMETARVVRDLDISAVKIHPLHIVRGTRMAEQYAAGEFALLSFDAYCDAVASVIRVLGPQVAIERFSGESPDDLLIAPDWSGNRNQIVARVEANLGQL